MNRDPAADGRHAGKSSQTVQTRACGSTSRHAAQETAALARDLRKLASRGDCSFEVVNDDHLQLPLPVGAERARRATVWLVEDVPQRWLLLALAAPRQMNRAT